MILGQPLTQQCLKSVGLTANPPSQQIPSSRYAPPLLLGGLEGPLPPDMYLDPFMSDPSLLSVGVESNDSHGINGPNGLVVHSSEGLVVSSPWSPRVGRPSPYCCHCWSVTQGRATWAGIDRGHETSQPVCPRRTVLSSWPVARLATFAQCMPMTLILSYLIINSLPWPLFPASLCSDLVGRSLPSTLRTTAAMACSWSAENPLPAYLAEAYLARCLLHRRPSLYLCSDYSVSALTTACPRPRGFGSPHTCALAGLPPCLSVNLV